MLIRKPDYQFKFILIGSSSVGKSSLLKRYADDQFSECYLATIGVDFKFKTQQINNNVVKLQIWDTAGQERFKTITTSYYKQAHAIFIVYDIQDSHSFDDILKYWIDEAYKHASPNAKFCIIGNKRDNQQKRSVKMQVVRQFCNKNKFFFFQVSAKTGYNVQQCFEAMSKICMKSYPKLDRCVLNDKQLKQSQVKKQKPQKLSLEKAKLNEIFRCC